MKGGTMKKETIKQAPQGPIPVPDNEAVVHRFDSFRITCDGEIHHAIHRDRKGREERVEVGWCSCGGRP